MERINGKDLTEIIQYFDIDLYQHQATGGYSAGMLKKLSISLAFAGNISWILLDEPFAFIDQETEEKLIRLINKRNATGINFIITSHHELIHDEIKFDNVYNISGAKLHNKQ
jgi:ABC-2 type transport system ATP-binding protein